MQERVSDIAVTDCIVHGRGDAGDGGSDGEPLVVMRVTLSTNVFWFVKLSISVFRALSQKLGIPLSLGNATEDGGVDVQVIRSFVVVGGGVVWWWCVNGCRGMGRQRVEMCAENAGWLSSRLVALRCLTIGGASTWRRVFGQRVHTSPRAPARVLGWGGG